MRIVELDRINELARKARLYQLSDAEQQERKLLHQAYIRAITGQMNNMLATVTVVDSEGADVTPQALRTAQKSMTQISSY